MMVNATGKIIVDAWDASGVDNEVRVSRIIDGRYSCEGIDACRYRAEPGSQISLPSDHGHIFSLLQGEGVLVLADGSDELSIDAGTHVYLPPSQSAKVRFLAQSIATHVFAPADRPHGEKLLVHSERYMAPSRFVLTPQYLSRRAFLHRDHTLISKSGDRIAWFHTTMFDTRGLPPNHDGLPVFKMSYNHQTEFNVIYDVAGEAGVRFAEHPYGKAHAQHWSDWRQLDQHTTYYLNECARGPEIEQISDPTTGKEERLRNKHEIYISPGGHVSLCCLFDPGPTGLETHQPGEYSAYAPVADTVDTAAYREFIESVSDADDVIRTLSYAHASSGGNLNQVGPIWATYRDLFAKALKDQEELIANAPPDRKLIMEAWRISHE